MKTLHSIEVPATPNSPAATFMLNRLDSAEVLVVQASMSCGPQTIRPGAKVLMLAEVYDVELDEPRIRIPKPLGAGAVLEVCRLVMEWRSKQ